MVALDPESDARLDAFADQLVAALRKAEWEITLDLIDLLLAKGVARAPFVGDAGYGQIPDFRRGLTRRGFCYVLGIQSTEQVWPPGWSPSPAGMKPPGRRRAENHLKQNPEIPALTVEMLALSLPPEAWRRLAWGQDSMGFGQEAGVASSQEQQRNRRVRVPNLLNGRLLPSAVQDLFLRPVEAHHSHERPLRRSQPVRLLVRARSLTLDIKSQPTVSIAPESRQHG